MIKECEPTATTRHWSRLRGTCFLYVADAMLPVMPDFVLDKESLLMKTRSPGRKIVVTRTKQSYFGLYRCCILCNSASAGVRKARICPFSCGRGARREVLPCASAGTALLV